MKQITLGSLFDGLGGWQLSAVHNGVKPIWSSEIEPFCIALTKERFPETIQLGDVRNVDGGKIPPVDILCMGFPCQDLSVANGERKGLQGERSGLFHDAIRVIRSMRDSTGGLYPKYVVLENVPGILSSCDGMDWRTVLASYTDTEIPIPRSGRWANAGLVRSRRATIGWIVKDAQYYGVPQRRARVFACIGFGKAGERVAEILFKPDGMSGNTPQECRKKQGVAGPVENGIGTTSDDSREESKLYENHAQDYRVKQTDTAPTLGTRPTTNPTLVMQESEEVVYDISQRRDVVRTYDEGIVPTLNALMGTGGNNVPIVTEDVTKVYAIEGNGSRPSHKGKGWSDSDTMYTLNTIEQHAVAVTTGGGKKAYAIGNGQMHQVEMTEKVGALNCMHDQIAIMQPTDDE